MLTPFRKDGGFNSCNCSILLLERGSARSLRLLSRAFQLFLPERLNSRIMPEPFSGCWIWIGARHKDGYGVFAISKGEYYKLAHRIIYEFLKGPIPKELEIDHVCRNKSCVNPNHLEAVTHAVNVARIIRAVITDCKRGHPLSGENVYRLGPNKEWRSCKICRRMLSDESRARQKRHEGVRVNTREIIGRKRGL
jgi:hypothetical protein